MTLEDFLEQVKNLPPETLLCVAELDEGFAAAVAQVEVVNGAREDPEATETEAIELANGDRQVIVLRW